MSTYNLHINPVDPSAVTNMPAVWVRLEKDGFHDDLVSRAKGFLAKARRDGHEDLAVSVLEWLGEGFTRKFDPQRFMPSADDPHRDLKINFVNGMKKLSEDFGDRVSAVVWESLVFLGTRGDPTKEATIRSQAKYLVHPWWLVDTSLHAVGKVFGFFMHVQSRVFESAGVALEHNCDCNHVVFEPQNGGSVRVFLPDSRKKEATAALLSHLFSESFLIGVAKFPFEMGITEEWKEGQTMAY